MGDDPTGQLQSAQLILRDNCLSGVLPRDSGGLELDAKSPRLRDDETVIVLWDNKMIGTRYGIKVTLPIIVLQLCEGDER